MTDLSLNCLLIGDDPELCFSVKISRAENVATLKKVIKHENSAALANVDAKTLVLWKVSIPYENLSTQINDIDSVKHTKLSPPLRELSSFFDGPEPQVVHVLVQFELDNEERQRKRRRTGGQHEEDRRTEENGVGRDSPPKEVSLDDAIRNARTFLQSISHSLKLAATTDPKLDGSNPFFVDGLGDLYKGDSRTKDRVLNLFGPEISKVVFNTSGSGKTRLLVEGLCQHWGFYLTPDGRTRLGSTDLSLSLAHLKSYIEEGESSSLTIPDSPTRGPESLAANRRIAQITFYHILLARLLVFEAFLSAGADIPATQLRPRWTHLQLVPSALKHQFSGDVLDIFEGVYQIIAQYRGGGNSWIRSLLTTIRKDDRVPSNSPFFVILDEAQLCAHLYEGAFYSATDTSPKGIRSVLREISVAWADFGRLSFAMIYSGTGFSLTKVLRALGSSLAGVDDFVFYDVGAFVSKEDQAAYITRHVELNEDTREEVLGRAWRWLRGRHRFTGGFVHVLKCCGAGNASALLTRYVKVLTGYTPMDGSNIQMTDKQNSLFPPFAEISQQFEKLDKDDSLRKRVADAVTNFMLRHTPQLFDATDADTIELGVSRYKTSSETDYKSIIIDEPLIIASLLQHFGRAESIGEKLRARICCLPMGPARGYTLEVIGMYVLAQQLDGTKSLRDIFCFRTKSINIGHGKAQLIAIDEINQDGSLRYSIVKEPWLYPLGMGFEAAEPSEHERWFKGTGVPFCFPDTRSGHDLGFFVLLDDNSIVFVTDQFKSYSHNLNASTTKRALQSLSPANCYLDKNGKIYARGRSTRETILKVLDHCNIPCLGILTSFPSNPHPETITNPALEHFALFDFSKVEGDLSQILSGFKDDQFPTLGDANYQEWPVEELGPDNHRK